MSQQVTWEYFPPRYTLTSQEPIITIYDKAYPRDTLVATLQEKPYRPLFTIIYYADAMLPTGVMQDSSGRYPSPNSDIHGPYVKGVSRPLSSKVTPTANSTAQNQSMQSPAKCPSHDEKGSLRSGKHSRPSDTSVSPPSKGTKPKSKKAKSDLAGIENISQRASEGTASRSEISPPHESFLPDASNKTSSLADHSVKPRHRRANRFMNPSLHAPPAHEGNP